LTVEGSKKKGRKKGLFGAKRAFEKFTPELSGTDMGADQEGEKHRREGEQVVFQK